MRLLAGALRDSATGLRTLPASSLVTGLGAGAKSALFCAGAFFHLLASFTDDSPLEYALLGPFGPVGTDSLAPLNLTGLAIHSSLTAVSVYCALILNTVVTVSYRNFLQCDSFHHRIFIITIF
jgi:hypothetical protein